MSQSIFHRGLARGAAHAPWKAAARRDILSIAAGVPFGLPAYLLLGSAEQIIATVLLTVACFDLLTTAQRSRLRALRGVDVPSRAPADADWLARLRSGWTWRQAAHHLLVAPALAAATLLIVAGWGAALVGTSVFAWVWLTPSTGPLRGEHGWMMLDLLVTFAGLALLLLLPWAAAWLARLDTRLVCGLLGPDRADLLARRVQDLAESRAGVVDAADAERRRIERDLHDGAQQRLVSLAMNLGLALRTLKDIPPEARHVISEAHAESLAVIEEIRDLVRGLHPVVLEDRGLDAALSGIAARSPVPVRLDVRLPGPVAPTVEAVAYFTVAEAVTNAAKHARASRVDLSIRQSAGRLHIVITDDGIGGADPSRGTGLTGLRKRAASVDGSLTMTSPRGGPTIITVELPCEL